MSGDGVMLLTTFAIFVLLALYGLFTLGRWFVREGRRVIWRTLVLAVRLVRDMVSGSGIRRYPVFLEGLAGQWTVECHMCGKEWRGEVGQLRFLTMMVHQHFVPEHQELEAA